MKERPLVAHPREVRAMLEGRQSQFRRVVKPQPKFDPPKMNEIWRCPYGQPGDRLWVRETWAPIPILQHVDGSIIYSDNAATYKASRDIYSGIVDRWRPSIHMPRRLSRILIEVTEVMVELVQDISSADAYAEGVSIKDPDGCDPVIDFANLWDSINAKRGYSWDANPWVWVVSFKRIDP